MKTDKGSGPPSEPLLRFGLNGWATEDRTKPVEALAQVPDGFTRDALAAYVRHRYRGRPLFRTLELEQTFHCPPSEAQLGSYCHALPAGFEMCSKVWEEITNPWYPNQPQYGAKAGQANTNFLNAKLFEDEVLGPYHKAARDRIGPFIFEFQQAGMVAQDFLPRLDEFFKRLSKDFRYAVEMKNGELLGPAYARVLRSHGVAHVLSHCAYMPSLLDQYDRLERMFSASFAVIRLMAPRARKGTEALRAGDSDPARLKSLPRMRKEAVRLIRQAVAEQRQVYVLVHNRLEGSAVITAQVLMDMVTAETAAAVQDLCLS